MYVIGIRSGNKSYQTLVKREISMLIFSNEFLIWLENTSFVSMYAQYNNIWDVINE